MYLNEFNECSLNLQMQHLPILHLTVSSCRSWITHRNLLQLLIFFCILQAQNLRFMRDTDLKISKKTSFLIISIMRH